MLDAKGWPNNRRDPQLDVDEIPKELHCVLSDLEVFVSVGVGENAAYGLGSEIKNLMTRTMINSNPDNFILRMYGKCRVIFTKPTYCVFDPHAVNTCGHVDPEGAACLMTFESFDKLVIHLQQLVPAGGINDQIDIYPVNIEMLSTNIKTPHYILGKGKFGSLCFQ